MHKATSYSCRRLDRVRDVFLHKVCVDGDRGGRSSSRRADHRGAWIDGIPPPTPRRRGFDPWSPHSESAFIQLATNPCQEAILMRDVPPTDKWRPAERAAIS